VEEVEGSKVFGFRSVAHWSCKDGIAVVDIADKDIAVTQNPEVTGNWPGRSVAISLWASVMAEKTRWVAKLAWSARGNKLEVSTWVERIFWRC
jgi:hypothetical protein